MLLIINEILKEEGVGMKKPHLNMKSNSGFIKDILTPMKNCRQVSPHTGQDFPGKLVIYGFPCKKSFLVKLVILKKEMIN